MKTLYLCQAVIATRGDDVERPVMRLVWADGDRDADVRFRKALEAMPGDWFSGVEISEAIGSPL